MKSAPPESPVSSHSKFAFLIISPFVFLYHDKIRARAISSLCSAVGFPATKMMQKIVQKNCKKHDFAYKIPGSLALKAHKIAS